MKQEYVSGESVRRLVELLHLPPPDCYEQDWEYVVGVPSRIHEFLQAYEDNRAILSDNALFTLMIIIIDSYNLGLCEGKDDEGVWESIRTILLRDCEIHAHTIEYWSSFDNDCLEDCFYVAPRMREIYAVINEC